MKIHLPLALGALLVAASADSVTAQAQSFREVLDTQQRLQVLGYYDGPIDGIWGPQTQAAAERYQQSRAIAITGERVEPTRAAVRTPPRLVALADPTDVRTVQNRLRQLNYYGGPADGVWSPGTQAAMENFQRSRGLQVGEIDTATISAMGLDPASFPARSAAALLIREPLEPGVIRGIQQRLRQYGYYNSRIDGLWGPATERGLVQFQRSRGLEPSGHLTPTTASALGLDPNNLAASAMLPR